MQCDENNRGRRLLRKRSVDGKVEDVPDGSEEGTRWRGVAACVPSSASESSDVMALYRLVFNF